MSQLTHSITLRRSHPIPLTTLLTATQHQPLHQLAHISKLGSLENPWARSAPFRNGLGNLTHSRLGNSYACAAIENGQEVCRTDHTYLCSLLCIMIIARILNIGRDRNVSKLIAILLPVDRKL
jgi:hypothetical protein